MSLGTGAFKVVRGPEAGTYPWLSLEWEPPLQAAANCKPSLKSAKTHLKHMLIDLQRSA